MNNIILLPETKNQIIETAHKALQESRYEEASELYEMLVQGNVRSLDIHVNLLVSLMKINELDKATDYAEQFLERYTNDDYLQIVELYIMILFEKNAFSDAIDLIHETLEETVPDAFKQKLEAIHQICYEQNVVTGKTLLKSFAQAIKDGNYREQWILLNKWNRLQVKPDDVFITYVQDPAVHPVIKTNLLEQLNKHHYNESIKIEKFGEVMTVAPSQLLAWDQEMQIDVLLESVEEIEHENPTLYQVIKELMYDYCYVMYPFKINVVDPDALQQAFLTIGRSHLSLDTATDLEALEDVNMTTYIKNIEICQQLYRSMTSSTI